MALAKAVAELITKNLRNGDGSPVECVIADSTIGRVAESAACAGKFEREGVGATITVTSCWCYGSETMDMNPHYPKAVWGFNGTERPGAVYLAAVLAAHAQKGLPAYGIYGHDVQDLDDNTIPTDVAEKLLKQMSKYKKKLIKKNQGKESVRFEMIPEVPEAEEETKIARTKKFTLTPMTAEEAILQMELLQHNFFVFLDAESGNVNVVYKRNDEDYGLLETEH